jgi:uncharacterized membrane protein YtjA (UPF0391 family)
MSQRELDHIGTPRPRLRWTGRPQNSRKGIHAMLRWAFVFLIVSLIAALFGFTDIAAASAGIAKILFFIFLVVFLVFLLLGVTAGRRITGPPV